MPEPKRPLKVFLCHAHADRDAVRALYTHRTKDGVDAWLDKAKLLPGQDWELEIKKAVREADVVVVCLSKQFNQTGFRQKEVRLALDTAMEKPEGEIFIIPARLEECDNLESLRKWHWVDLFENGGYEKLMRALQRRANTIGITLQVKEIQSTQSSSKRDVSDLFYSDLITIFVFVATSIILYTQLNSVLQFFYDLFSWQYFKIVTIIWLAVDFLWIERWTSLIGRVGKLITKPLVFKADEEPNTNPFYPRTLLEEIALSNRFENQNNIFTQWVTKQRNRVFDSENPLRTLGYLISLVLFLFFLNADAIVVGNMLWLTGVIHRSPDVVYRLDLAILGGAVLTTVVSVWMSIEMSGKGELINVVELTDAQKRLRKLFAVIGVLLSVVVMLALAVQRLINLNFIQSIPTMDILLSFVLYGLLAINNLLSAVFTFPPATFGLIVVLHLSFVIFPVLAFILDMFGRLIYIVVDTILWALFTPIIAISYGIGKIYSLKSITKKNR